MCFQLHLLHQKRRKFPNQNLFQKPKNLPNIQEEEELLGDRVLSEAETSLEMIDQEESRPPSEEIRPPISPPATPSLSSQLSPIDTPPIPESFQKLLENVR